MLNNDNSIHMCVYYRAFIVERRISRTRARTHTRTVRIYNCSELSVTDDVSLSSIFCDIYDDRAYKSSDGLCRETRSENIRVSPEKGAGGRNKNIPHDGREKKTRIFLNIFIFSSIARKCDCTSRDCTFRAATR